MNQYTPIEWTDEKVAEFWNYIASNKALSDNYFTKLHGESIINHINHEIGLRSKSVLDYGSGPGHLFNYIIKKKIPLEYSALDFSEDSIKNLDLEFGNHPYYKESFFVERFPTHINKKFDLIICCEVLEHLSDIQLANFIKEIKALLKKDGFLYLTTPNNEDLMANTVCCPNCFTEFHRWQHQRTWNRKNINEFMESNGLKTLKIVELSFPEYNGFGKMKRFIKKHLFRKILNNPNLCYIGTAAN